VPLWQFFWGGCTVAAPASLPSVLPINTEGESTKRGGGWKAPKKNRPEEEERKKEHEKNKKEKTERKQGKTGGETAHRHRQQRRLEPPPSASTTVSLHSSHCRSVPTPLSSSFFPFSAPSPFAFICMQNMSNSRSAANENN
jgi:hypothetical protein